MSLPLTAKNVHDLFVKCLFTDKEDKTNYIEAQGVQLHIGFHPDRIEEHKETINAMIDELPDNFKKTGGGGWSFLNACIKADGTQWADLHRTIDQLLCLGLATKKIEFQMPREFWGMFPGGMPYFLIN